MGNIPTSMRVSSANSRVQLSEMDKILKKRGDLYDKSMIYFTKLFFSLFFYYAVSVGISAASTIKSSVGLGFFYSEGEYQNRDTSVLRSFPIFFSLQKGLTSFKVASNVYRFKRKDVSTAKKTISNGWGSTHFTVKRLFKMKRFIHYIDIAGRINTPTPDIAEGLSLSGYGFKLSSTAYYWASKNWFTVRFSYRWRNNVLRDTFSGALGFSRVLSKKFSIGAILDYEQATQNISSDKLEGTFHTTWKAHKQIKYSFYYIKGFNDQKLNWASGLQVTYSW